MRGSIAEGTLAGLSFLRLYLVDPGAGDNLEDAAREHDCVTAYSLEDLGEVDRFTSERKWTQLLPLDGDVDELSNRLDKNNRYKVRRSYRDSEVVVVVDDEAREESYAFYRAVKEEDGVVPDFEDDFESVRWTNAYHRGKLVSSVCWYDSGEVLRAKHIVSTRKRDGADSGLIGRLTRRLFWEACLTGLSEGHRYVDLGGLDPQDPKKRGVADFKRSFGGETVETLFYRFSTPAWRRAAEELRRSGSSVF